MSPERVQSQSEVSINAIRYPLLRPVQSVLASIYPPKIIIGDPSKDSGTGLSVVSWSDFSGGMGRYRMEGSEDVNRAWILFGQRRKGHFVLPALQTQTAAATAAAVGAMGELADEIYAAFGTAVHKYNNSTDSWGASLATLPAAATDAITVRLGGTTYLIFATTGGYTYTSDGVVFTNDTTDTKYLAFWDERLWGIDNNGQLWFALTIGTETNDAQLQLPTGWVTDLLIGRDAGGDEILYAASKVGLHAHDASNQKFVATGLQVPRNDNAGVGCVNWRDALYYPADAAIYKYQTGGGGAAVSPVGPDKDDGLESTVRGIIGFLLGTHRELMAFMRAGTTNNFILGWDERGWEIKGGNANTASPGAGLVSMAYGSYRLWWENNQRVYYIPLEMSLVNPNVAAPGGAYEASSPFIDGLVTPWFTAGQDDVDKLAVRLRLEVQGASANETVVVKYATNFSATYTTLGTIVASGLTSYDFPNSTTPTGTVFRAIRFSIDLVRGGTNTLTPDVQSFTLEYRKKLPAKWGHVVEVDIREYKGNTAKQLRSNLLTAIEKTDLVEFTFRDDSGNTRNFYVDVVQATGLEFTGGDERGVSRVTMVER